MKTAIIPLLNECDGSGNGSCLGQLFYFRAAE
jgi:hypothetical protein